MHHHASGITIKILMALMMIRIMIVKLTMMILMKMMSMMIRIILIDLKTLFQSKPVQRRGTGEEGGERAGIAEVRQRITMIQVCRLVIMIMMIM